MYKQKQHQLMQELKEKNIDVALVTSPINIYYLTGFLSDPSERFFVLTLNVKNETTTLFLPKLDEEAGKAQAAVDQFIAIDDTDEPYEIFYKETGTNIEKLAIEKQIVTVHQLEQYRNWYPKVQFDEIDSLLIDMRSRKSSEEIIHMKRAIEITEQGLDQLIPQIKRGMTEMEIKALLEFTLKRLGAEGIAFDTLVLVGENAAQPHGVSGDRIVEEGEFLLFDFGVTVNGYHSDITRTFIIGEPSDEQRTMYETVLRANEAAIAAVKVNTPLKNIDIAARKVITDAGYGPYFIHRTGHGLGLDVHELPSIHNENEGMIEPGLLFTIEPGVYISELGGVRIEDNIYITPEGEVEILTSYPKALTSINLL